MNAESFERRFLQLLWLGALLAAGLALVDSPLPMPVDSGLVAHVSGLVAGYLAAIMVVLMSRVPILERRIGPDVLARWHGRGGRTFLILVLVHAGAAVQSWATARHEDSYTALFHILGLPGLMAATVGTVIFVVIAAISIRTARRKLSYERWHGIHLLTYVAILLSFVHELGGPNMAGHPVIQITWSLLYLYALALVLRFRLLAPLEYLWRHRLRVEAVIPEANGVMSLVLRGRHLNELGAESGQFFRWRFLTRSTFHMAHPFSLSAPPRNDLLRITVKQLGAGTSQVHAIQPGTLVLAEGPSGAMTARRRTRDSVLLIAGGVGITPMRAMFETLEHRGGQLTLLYRASTPGDVIFRHELEQIAQRRGAQLIWMIGRSADPENQMTADNLRRLVPDIAERDVYLCAAPALAAAVRKGLSGAGVPARHFHEENFAF